MIWTKTGLWKQNGELKREVARWKGKYIEMCLEAHALHENERRNTSILRDNEQRR